VIIIYMNPKQLSNQLRKIASKIDSSKSPKRSLVAGDLKKILASLDSIRFENIDPFTVLVQAMEKVANGESTPQEAADYISERPDFSSVNWTGKDDTESYGDVGPNEGWTTP
jgi:hypothetical protein